MLYAIGTGGVFQNILVGKSDESIKGCTKFCVILYKYYIWYTYIFSGKSIFTNRIEGYNIVY